MADCLEGRGCGIYVNRETWDSLGPHRPNKRSSGGLLVASAGGWSGRDRPRRRELYSYCAIIVRRFPSRVLLYGSSEEATVPGLRTVQHQGQG